MKRKTVMAMMIMASMCMATYVSAAPAVPSPQRGENTTQAEITNPVQEEPAQDTPAEEENRDVIIQNTNFEEYPQEEQKVLNSFNDYVYENATNSVADTFAAIQEKIDNGELPYTDAIHFDLSQINLFQTGDTVNGKEHGEALTPEETQELVKSMNFLTGLMEVKFVNVEPTIENPVTLTLTDSSLASLTEEDKNIYVIYFCPDPAHNRWELLKADRPEAEEGEEARMDQINVEFHAGNSLAAIVYVKPDDASLIEKMAAQIRPEDKEEGLENLVEYAQSDKDGVIRDKKDMKDKEEKKQEIAEKKEEKAEEKEEKKEEKAEEKQDRKSNAR